MMSRGCSQGLRASLAKNARPSPAWACRRTTRGLIASTRGSARPGLPLESCGRGSIRNVEAPHAIGEFTGREAHRTLDAADFVDVEAVELVSVTRVRKLDRFLSRSAPVLTPDPETADLQIVAFDSDVNVAPTPHGRVPLPHIPLTPDSR